MLIIRFAKLENKWKKEEKERPRDSTVWRPAVIKIAISAFSTLIGCVSLPALVVAYWVEGDILSLLKGKATIPVWYLLVLIFLLLFISAIAIGLWLTRPNPKKDIFSPAPDISDPQRDEQLIRDYMLRIKGILANGSSYKDSQISQKLKLNEFNERHYKNFQQAIGRLVEEGIISSGKSNGTYQLL